MTVTAVSIHRFGRVLGVAAVLLALKLSPGAPSHRVDAGSAGGLVSSCGAATVDGVVRPGEWDTASTYVVQMVRASGADPFTATLHVMDSGHNLYLGITLADDEFSSIGKYLPSGDGFRIDFDNDSSGSLFSQGDEVLGCYADFPQFGDGFLDPAPDSSERSSADITRGGTLDGRGVASRADDLNHFELVHPLCSGDSLDFCLRPGDSVGFRLEYFDAEGDDVWHGSWIFPGPDWTSEATLILGQCSEPVSDLYTFLPLALR